MQATHFRMAEGVDAGLTNSAVRPLSWVRMGSKLVVSFATDGAAAEVGALRFEGFEGGPREEWKGFLMIFFMLGGKWAGSIALKHTFMPPNFVFPSTGPPSAIASPATNCFLLAF